MSLDKDAALVITQAQNILSGVKDMFPDVIAKEAPYTLKLKPEDVIAEVAWLLGRHIPKLARAGHLERAREKLARAQGLLLGVGSISYHDVELIRDTRPLSPAQKARFGGHRSLETPVQST